MLRVRNQVCLSEELGMRRQLQGNNLNGTLPQFGAGSWVSLSALNLTGNDFVKSPLPPAWGSTTMGSLKYLDLANCSLSGASL